MTLLTGEDREDTESLGVRVLRDLRNIFDGKKAERLSTDVLLRKLRAAEDAPWGSLRGEPLDARGLARLLKPYGVRPEKLREGKDTFRGYRRSNFEDAWSRYTPDTPKKRNIRNTWNFPLIERYLVFRVTAMFLTTLRIRNKKTRLGRAMFHVFDMFRIIRGAGRL